MSKNVIPSEERDPPQHFTKTHNHKEKRAYVLFIKDILWNKEWDPSSSTSFRSGWHIKEMVFGRQCLKTSSRAKRGIPDFNSPKHTLINQTVPSCPIQVKRYIKLNEVKRFIKWVKRMIHQALAIYHFLYIYFLWYNTIYIKGLSPNTLSLLKFLNFERDEKKKYLPCRRTYSISF